MDEEIFLQHPLLELPPRYFQDTLPRSDEFGGFDANLATQTATAQTYITAMYIWVPIITNIATIITMMFYDLDKIYPQIVKELDERRANA